MITCKTCHKFAKLEDVIINGLDEVKLIGSCKHCDYQSEPKTVDEHGIKLTFTKIGESRIDYDDFDDLGIDENKSTQDLAHESEQEIAKENVEAALTRL